MKSYSLVVVLFLLLIVSSSYAEILPVPDENTDESSVEVEVAVEPETTPLNHYSPLIAGFGNIIPGLGYFLIDEPGWAWAELGIMGGGAVLGFLIAYPGDSSRNSSLDGYMIFMFVTTSAYIASIIHAPLLASYKYNQQKVALDLSPGVGLDSEGEVYPTIQLTLSF
ncbi:hypothetical protein K8R78_00870 [bacterium]|nr:hypothetical protein [bacterium]